MSSVTCIKCCCVLNELAPNTWAEVGITALKSPIYCFVYYSVAVNNWVKNLSRSQQVITWCWEVLPAHRGFAGFRVNVHRKLMFNKCIARKFSLLHMIYIKCQCGCYTISWLHHCGQQWVQCSQGNVCAVQGSFYSRWPGGMMYSAHYLDEVSMWLLLHTVMPSADCISGDIAAAHKYLLCCH